MRSGRGIEFLNSLEQWRGQGGFSPQSLELVLSILGNPQDQIPAIHVGGTNGKGSVCAAIASILGAAGWRVGLTISPHLSSFTERIVLDGSPVSLENLDACALKLREAVESSRVKLSYFEAMVGCAFLVFSEVNLDFMVIEVGLGGRLDATNVIRQPRVSVIVSIDFDHQDLLGNSLVQIAQEKGGIIKDGCPVVLGSMEAGPLEALSDIATMKGSPRLVFGHDFWVEGQEKRNNFKFVETSGNSFGFQSSLQGSHQGHNMGVAIAAAQLVGASSATCADGVGNVFWPGRLEEVTGLPRRVILDAAHNVAGVRSLCAFLHENSLSPVSIGFGALSTKDWRVMIELLVPFVGEWYILTPDSSSAVRSDEMAAHLSGIGIKFQLFESDYEGFVRDVVFAKASRPLVIGGSMYLMGKLRGMIVKDQRPLWNRCSELVNRYR